MHHAEESMEIFEYLIYQKEMEIASLDYQVQGYRYKLLSLGCVDLGVGKIKLPENMLQINETLIAEASAQSIIGRRNSVPPKSHKLSNFLKKGTSERERSSSPETDMISTIVEEGENYRYLDLEKTRDGSLVDDINSYWEHIRHLDERVKKMTGEQYVNSTGIRSRSSSVFSQMSSGMGCDTKKEGIANENLMENETISDSACSLSVHNVFEVPQTAESLIRCEKQPKDEGKLVLQSDERAIKSFVKDEVDLGKKIILSTQGDSDLCKPSDGIVVVCRLVIVLPAAAVVEAQAKFRQMRRTTEIIEGERQDLRQQTTTRGKEELKLLIEIREQLNSIQLEIRSCQIWKTPPQYDLAMLSIMERIQPAVGLHMFTAKLGGEGERWCFAIW